MKNVTPFCLKGKTIIVTGASSGIGRQCAISCSKMGAKVAAFGRDHERLAETLNLMESPEKHRVWSVDLHEYNTVADIVNEVVSFYGMINGLVNCAGISTTLPLNSITIQKMEEFVQTNVIGPINLTKHVVKATHFSEAGGSVIFISSVMGVAGENGKTLYSMTKGALVASVKSMAIELAQKKIRVNTISPGVVVTPMSNSSVYSMDEVSFKRITGLHPLGLGNVEDIANACVFLLSDAARWITGTNLIIDGGYLAK
jgi:NAD(P)-dependent dehydrogenase (short-subunit alcohol dehydrogenase family)